jgi:hypothetical protein
MKKVSALKKLQEENRELRRDLDDEILHRLAACRAHDILQAGIKKALGLEKWPDFYKLYGGNGLFAEGVVRYLLEHVQLKPPEVKVLYAKPKVVKGKGVDRIIDAPRPNSSGGRRKR